MKKYFFWLAITSIASFNLFSQGATIIQFDYNKLRETTSSAKFGDLLPISEQLSMINIGEAKLGIVNNQTGVIEQFFDEQLLKTKLDALLKAKYKGVYQLFTDTELSKLPLCQKLPFVYKRLFYLEQEAIYACEVWCLVKQTNSINDWYDIKGVAFLTQDLKLIQFYERAEYESALVASSIGGFFHGKDHFFIKKVTPDPDAQSEFIHFSLDDGKYHLDKELTTISSATKPNYFTGRFYTMFKIGSNYYLYNSNQLITTPNLFNKGQEIHLKLNPNEIIGTLRKVNDQKLIGIRQKLGPRRNTLEAILFEADPHFNKVKDLLHFDLSQTTINSIVPLNDKVYLYLFDRKNKKYILDVFELK